MLQEIIKDIYNNEVIVVDSIHIHNKNEDYAEVNKVFKDVNEDGEEVFIASHSISGGKNECVWNTYTTEHNTAIEALLSFHPIDEYL